MNNKHQFSKVGLAGACLGLLLAVPMTAQGAVFTDGFSTTTFGTGWTTAGTPVPVINSQATVPVPLTSNWGKETGDNAARVPAGTGYVGYGNVAHANDYGTQHTAMFYDDGSTLTGSGGQGIDLRIAVTGTAHFSIFMGTGGAGSTVYAVGYAGTASAGRNPSRWWAGGNTNSTVFTWVPTSVTRTSGWHCFTIRVVTGGAQWAKTIRW
ncbi:MAG TPA: hypothetical protein VLM89_00375, partial [Phycisphaerae bacterium]|nr:hypothetical protein [Phycisphaerae bacterium]